VIPILDRALKSQRYLTFLRLVSVAVWLFLGILWAATPETSNAITNLPLGFRVLANVLAGAIDLIALPGSIVLWISAIYYWRHVDLLNPGKRAFWLAILLLGFCFGASVYCWVRIRALATGQSAGGDYQPTVKNPRLRILKILTLASWTLSLGVAFLGYPAHPILSHDNLASLALVLAPTTIALSLASVAAVFLSKRAA
jgi:hypothetical protein